MLALSIGLMFLLLAGLMVPSSVMAQERFGSITGQVTDPSKAVMPGVTVTITNKETNRTYTTTTGTDGNYYARDLEPGRYDVTFELKGFAKAVIPDVILLLGKTSRLDAALQVGAVEQTVEVIGETPMVDTNSTMVAHNVTSDEFDRLPKSRSFQDIALTSPSVTYGQVEGGIQVHGASAAENNYIIDGVSTTSIIDGTSRQDANYEYLQEVQVKTSGLEAEYGGALGGVISAVTKSGGNAFHGDVYWYNSGSPFNGDPNPRLVVDPINQIDAKDVQDSKTKDHINEIGGAVGGYILKNKLYFFTAFSPVIEHQEANYLFDGGTTPGTFKSTLHTLSLFNKLSWDPTSRIRTNFSWLYTTLKATGILPPYDGYGSNFNVNPISTYDPNKNQGFYIPKNNYSGSVDVTLSNTALLSFKGGYFWDNYKDTNPPSQHTIIYRSSAIGLPFEIPPDMQQPNGWYNVPPITVNYFDITSRGYFQGDFSKIFHLGGTHNLKGGAGFAKNVNIVNTGYQGGGYETRIYWDRSFTNFAGEAGRGTYGYYALRVLGTQGSAGSTIDNLYIQDQWRIHPRLSLSLGLRTEHENIPSFRRDIQNYAMQFGWGDKLSPRLGASYDVFGNGKLKIFGSWGRFFDWTKYSLVRGSFGGDVWTEAYHALDTLDLGSISPTNLPGKNLWNDVPGSVRDFRIPSFGSDAVDPNIKPMSQDTMVFGGEYELNPRLVVGAHYVRSSLNRTIEDIGQVLPDGSQIYPLGNPGEGNAKTETNHISATPDFAMPKPKRIYDALELSVNRRFSNGWLLGANYTYSKLWGNYPGLSDTDEIAGGAGWAADQGGLNGSGSAIGARPGTNTSTQYDDEAYLKDARGQYLYGRLPTDRPHVFKVYGSYQFKWGTQVSANFFVESGTPLSTTVEDTIWDVMIVNGRGDLGRTPTLNQTNFMVSHEFKIKEGMHLRFEFNVLNLFNQQTVRYIDNLVTRDRDPSASMDLTNVNLLNGFNWQELVAQSTYAQDPSLTKDPHSFDPHQNYAINPTRGMASFWNPPFAARFGIKFIF
ncbi:MAG TPA: carboxypeptidase regulatory-like domain-containing protein [Terriglobia bacterium]|nr:carboxypeptidase regulatory-like domain-containing protein [Terriglobia bacterium]